MTQQSWSGKTERSQCAVSECSNIHKMLCNLTTFAHFFAPSTPLLWEKYFETSPPSQKKKDKNLSVKHYHVALGIWLLLNGRSGLLCLEDLLCSSLGLFKQLLHKGECLPLSCWNFKDFAWALIYGSNLQSRGLPFLHSPFINYSHKRVVYYTDPYQVLHLATAGTEPLKQRVHQR